MERNSAQDVSIHSKSDAVSIIDIFKIIIKQKKIVSFVFLTTLSVAIIYSVFAEDVYRSEIIFIESESLSSDTNTSLSSLNGLGSLAGLTSSNKTREEEVALQTLFSKKFLYEFIIVQPLIAEKLLDKDVLKPGKDWKNDNRIIEDLYISFKELINLDSNTQTNIHTLSVSWDNPVESANLANDLIKYLNEYTRLSALKKIEQRIKFLQIEQSSSNLVNNKVIFSKLIESQLRENMLANTQQEYSFEVIDPAKVTSYPHSPRRLYLIFISLFIGLFIGVIFAILKEYFNQNKISIKN